MVKENIPIIFCKIGCNLGLSYRYKQTKEFIVFDYVLNDNYALVIKWNPYASRVNQGRPLSITLLKRLDYHTYILRKDTTLRYVIDLNRLSEEDFYNFVYNCIYDYRLKFQV